MYVHDIKSPRPDIEAKFGKNQSTGRTEARDKAENRSVCQVAATHRRAYTSRVFFTSIIISFIFRFITANHRFQVARQCSNPYAVLFRSFVCQIFIERFGMAVNERETSSTSVRNRKKGRRGRETEREREERRQNPSPKFVHDWLAYGKIKKKIIGDFAPSFKWRTTNNISRRYYYAFVIYVTKCVRLFRGLLGNNKYF